jgi:hypothetical protein
MNVAQMGHIVNCEIDRVASRGRNAGYPVPPAQTRTCGFPASYVANHIRCVMLRTWLCGEVIPSMRYHGLVR